MNNQTTIVNNSSNSLVHVKCQSTKEGFKCCYQNGHRGQHRFYNIDPKIEAKWLSISWDEKTKKIEYQY